MKKITLVVAIMLLAILVISLTACGDLGSDGDPDSSNGDVPTEASIIAGLNEMPNIVDIAAATEYNDPNGQLNKEGGYVAHVYFSVDVIDQDQILGVTLIEKGTNAGGSIEVYKTVNDAKKRDEYLSTFDGTVFTSGSHKVVGTCVVRTSYLLTASLQNILANNIEKMLTKSNEAYVSMDMYLYSVAKEVAEKDNLSQYETAIALATYGYPWRKVETIVKNCGVNFSDIAKKLAEGYEDFYATVSPLMIAELLDERLFDADNISYAIQNADIDWATYATIHAQSYANQVESENECLTPIDILVYLCWEKGYVYDWEDWIFDKAEYTYIALENIDVNWNQKAVEYIEYVEYESNYAIKNDYISELLDMEFTQEQAEYAVAHCDIDWNQRAYLSLQHYIDECTTAPTKSKCITVLKGWGFTQSECYYALSQFTCKEIPSLGHKYQSIVIAPTCTERGYTMHSCSGCGDSYMDTYVDASGVHDFQTSNTCTFCKLNIANVAVEVYDMSATSADNVKCYIVPRLDGNYDAYIKGTGAMKNYTFNSYLFDTDDGGYTLINAYIGSNVTTIGNNVFRFCSSLTSAIIQNSVTSIGNYAFDDCSSLTSVTFGTNSQLTTIGDSAFYDCDKLTSITIPNSVASIGEEVFKRCSGLTSISIPDSVTSIGDAAFSGCSGLTNVTIGNGVTSIASGAFYGCSSLASIVIPDGVTSIGGTAFYECSSLASITIPDSVTSIGTRAFYKCTSLKTITITDSATSSTISNGATSIGLSAFYGCSSLTSITIPDGVTSIGDTAFFKCNSLTSIVIPDSVTSIGNQAFYVCESLTSIEIPDNVTSIGESAFGYCSSLTSVSVGEGVTNIGDYAFVGCKNLTSVTFEDPNGWYVTQTEGAISGTNLTLTNASTNATYLKNTYYTYYWYKL